MLNFAREAKLNKEMIQMNDEYSEMYKQKLNLDFPSLITIGAYQDDEKLGEFFLSFNCLNDLIHSQFEPSIKLKPEVENKLCLMSIEFIFLVNHHNINEVIHIINEKKQLPNNITLKLD